MDLTSPFNFTLASMQLVYTSRGVVFAEKLQKGDGLMANIPSPQELSNNLAVGVKPALLATLQNGNHLIVGDQNQVYTPRGWKLVKDLVPGDLVLQRLVLTPPSGDGGELIHYTQQLNTDAMPIVVPKKMSGDFAKWLGIFVACGEFNHYDGRISVRLNQEELINEYYELTKKIFRITPLVLKDKRGNRKLEHYFISQNITKFLSQNIGRGSLQKVPTFLMGGSNSEHLQFIAGLSFNFSLYKKKNPIIYQGESKLVAEFVAMVLRHNGYIISIYKDDYSKQETRPDRYTTLIMGVHEKASEISGNKELNPHLNLPLNVLVDITPSMDNLNIPSYHPNYRAFMRLKKDSLKLCAWSVAKNLGVDLSDNHYYFVAVKSVQQLPAVKQVTLKVLYPEGFLLNNTILSGQY